MPTPPLRESFWMLPRNILAATRRCDVICALTRTLHVATRQVAAPRDYRFLPGEFSILQIQLTPVMELVAPPRKDAVCKLVQTIPVSSAVPLIDKGYPEAFLCVAAQQLHLGLVTPVARPRRFASIPPAH